jgi:hypothetical protein
VVTLRVLPADGDGDGDGDGDAKINALGTANLYMPRFGLCIHLSKTLTCTG